MSSSLHLKSGTRPPWVSLGAAVFLQIASGNAYNFPLYSHSLKSALGFNQHQLAMLGVANDVGENVGILPGIFCNKYPPWVVVSIGAVCCLFGYGVLWLAVSGTVEGLPFWLLWFALCVATNSSAWFSTAVIVTSMRNFPLTRGTVVGILKGYGGISAAVYTVIYTVVLRKSSSNLLLFLAIGVPAMCTFTMHFLKPCVPATGDDSMEHCNFVFIEATSVVLGIYLLATTILNNVLSLGASYTFVIPMLILLMAPLAIPIKMSFYPSDRSKMRRLVTNQSDEGDDRMDKTEPLLASSSSTRSLGSLNESDSVSDVNALLAEGEGAVKKKRRPRRGEDFRFREALVKADFWLLFFVFFVGVGSGVTVLNNLAQIGIAQGIHDTTILLSLFAFGNFIGRLGGGAVSEHFIRSRLIPRPFWMTCTQILMIITYLAFAYAIDGTLYATTALLGICYGVQFSIMVPTASELFGLQNFGTFYNFLSLGNPLGALLFSGLLAGYVYDIEAGKQHLASCIGPHCFRLTFLVLAGICGIGAVLSIVLTRRIKPVYENLYSGGSNRPPQNTPNDQDHRTG